MFQWCFNKKISLEELMYSLSILNLSLDIYTHGGREIREETEKLHDRKKKYPPRAWKWKQDKQANLNTG